MANSKKITFIGGGSYQWVPPLFRDIAVNEHLQDIQFVLHDIDPQRSQEMADVCQIVGRKLGSSIAVETEDDLDHAISGADAVILCISTGGLDAMEHDIEIPKKYGIYQPVGDSTGPGGISRTLRNVPVVIDLARRMETLCPDAWLINLTNPMNRVVRTVQQVSRINVIGLCHEYMSFMGTVQHLLGLKDWEREVSSTIVGINHFAWITEFKVHGQDGLQLLRERMNHWELSAEANGANAVNPSHTLSKNRIKSSLFHVHGVVPYPGDRHLAEFFPYFLSEKNGHGADYGVKLTSIEERRTTWMGWYTERIARWTNDSPDSVPRQPSNESLAPILAALVSNGPATVQPATMPNLGQVAELSLSSSVETIVTFANGLASPHAGGSLPPSVLALVQKHCLNQDLMVEAAIEGSRAKALQAMLADPLNNNNDFREIETMLDELLQANASLLPQFFPQAVRNGSHRAEVLVEA
jgi:alpha-galactosidase/6-phospho-beta-glucosidase family protein